MSLTARDLARAEALGRVAARGGLSVDHCPYPADGTPDERTLAGRFVHAYVGAGGKVAVDYDDGAGTSEGAPRYRPVEHHGQALKVAVRRPPPDDDGE